MRKNIGKKVVVYGLTGALLCGVALTTTGCLEALHQANSGSNGGVTQVTAPASGGGSTGTTNSGKASTAYAQFSQKDNGHVVSEETLKKLDRLASYLNQYYLYDIDETKLEDALCEALMESLDEPYTCYYDKESFDKLMEDTEGTYCGIGSTLLQLVETKEVQVVYPFKNSPAREAGLQTGDLILGVDDVDISEMDLEEIVTYIRGEEGTDVVLKIYRPSTKEQMDITVTRRMVQVDTVDYEMLEDKIGYVAIWQFEDPTAGQVKDAIEDLKSQGMESLVLDLRDNPGGLVDSCVAITGYFLDDQLVVYTEDKYGSQNRSYASAGTIYDGKMAILINGNSASASEILTGAMIDYDRAEIFGTQSFGKGIVQSVVPLPDGTGMKYTTADYYTPNGNNIHGIGLTPDTIVEDDPDTEDDEQLNAAIEYLKK